MEVQAHWDEVIQHWREQEQLFGATSGTRSGVPAQEVSADAALLARTKVKDPQSSRNKQLHGLIKAAQWHVDDTEAAERAAHYARIRTCNASYTELMQE